jgi:hypothetical protein
MPEEMSRETKEKLRRSIQENRGGYKRAWNPKHNPAYDVAYIKAKELIACGMPKVAAYARAGITGDAFRLRQKWEKENSDVTA